MKSVVYTKTALKTLSRMPTNTARLIRAKIEQYAAEPESLASNIKKLTGEFTGITRLRVGDWRVFLDEAGVVLLVVAVHPRGSAYD